MFTEADSPVRMAAGSDSDRRTLLLDATLRLIGAGGLRAVTHRAVELEAGVLHGSVTYYFRTRDQLIAAAGERLVELDRRRTGQLAHELAMALARPDGGSNIERVTAAVVTWIDEERSTQIARYELQLAGARDPELRQIMSSGAALFWRLLEPVAVAVGSDAPPRDARMIVAVLDGLLLDGMTHEPSDPQIMVDGIRHLLASFGAGSPE